MEANILNNLNLDSPNIQQPNKTRPSLLETAEHHIQHAKAKIARMEAEGHSDEPTVLYERYKRLRLELKRMNELLSHLLDSKNSCKRRPKPVDILSRKSKPRSDMPEDVLLRYRDSEMMNSQKILKNLV